MKYINSINVSTGSAPGEYAVETFAPNTTANGYMYVNLTIPLSGTVNVTMIATGENTISEPYSFYLISTPEKSVGNPIVWMYRVSIPASQNATDPPGAHTGTNAHSQGADPAFPYNIAYTAIAAVALIAIGVGLVFVSRIRGGKV